MKTIEKLKEILLEKDWRQGRDYDIGFASGEWVTHECCWAIL